jgi:hypothetical protein
MSFTMTRSPTISWSFNLEGSGFGHDREIVVNRTVHSAPRRTRGTTS